MKTTYQLDSSELKAAIEAWMVAKGTPVTDADEFTVDANGNVTIIVTISHPSVPVAVVPVVVPPAVIVVPEIPVVVKEGPLSGHAVTGNPPFSATVRATQFGIDPDGSDDKGDQDSRGRPLEGFFYDPKTKKPYITHVKDLIGASLPRETMLSTFLGMDSWKLQGIGEIWSKYGSTLRQWVDDNKPFLNIDSGGKTILGVPLVDAGPSARTGNGLDLTCAAAILLDTKGDAMATYEIILHGKAIPISGWPLE